MPPNEKSRWFHLPQPGLVARVAAAIVFGAAVQLLWRDVAADEDPVNRRDAFAEDSAADKDGDGASQIVEAAAVNAFEARYALAEDQVLKFFPPPHADERLIYYQARDPGQADAIPRGPDAMYLRWENEKLNRWGMTFGQPTLPTIVRMLVEVFPQDIDGDAELLETPIPGDFVVRVGADTEKVLAQLENAVEEVVGYPVRIAFREIEREVAVARGEYELTPIDPERDRIEIYGERLNKDPRLGGGGSGEFDDFLAWVGMWIDMPVVSEVEMPPAERLSWHYNYGDARTAEERKAAKDPVLVLLNLNVQTNLEFSIEPRKVRMLMIERAAAD